MKKVLTLMVLSSVTALSINATEVHEHEVTEQEHKTNFYVAVKAIATLGDTLKEEHATLEGDTGKGIGIDLGYKLPYGFSIEVDGTYVANNVTETNSHGDKEEFSASYMTTSLDIAYKYHLTHELGAILKTGYEYEVEKIDALDIDHSDTGFIFAAALEYEVGENIAVLGEYEHTTIEGPRGDSIFAGVVYNF